MQQKEQPRATSFLLVMSWLYIIFGLGMAGFAIYQLTNSDIQLTFRVATESVFLIVEGLLGIFAGIFGLVSKHLKRCRIIGLVLLGISSVPLIINLLAGGYLCAVLEKSGRRSFCRYSICWPRSLSAA